MRQETGAEAHFITLCVREPSAVAPDELVRAASAVREWEALRIIADEHRVAAFILQATERVSLPLPEGVRDAIERVALARQAHVLLLDLELGRALKVLSNAAIPAIVLKGPALARTIYPAGQIRPYVDLDLLVNQEQEAAAAATLAAAGFEPFPQDPEKSARTGLTSSAQASFHQVFFGGNGRAPLELHADPLQLGLRPRCESGRWQRARPIPGLGAALMLCPEDQLVQLSVHVHKHGFSRLIWLKDLDLLMRTTQHTLDWPLVLSVAQREGVRASVWYSLHLAAQLLATPVPAEVSTRLRPNWSLRRLYRLIWPDSRIANLQGHLQRRAVQFDPGESWRGTLPALVLMGRRGTRLRLGLDSLLQKGALS
jgi:Uncharacterised nucleotidyltransferase